MSYTEKEFADARRKADQLKKDRAFKALFTKKDWSQEIWDLSRYERTVCFIKLFLCLLLDRTKGTYLDNDMFCFLAYDERSCCEFLSWEAVWVSPKLFSGWQICLATDGT